MYAAGHSLQAGARGRDDSHRLAAFARGLAAHAIGEPEAHAVHDRGAAIRPHDEQAAFARRVLQSHFVVEADVVAVQEDVFAEIQRLACHAGRVPPRHADEHPACVGQLAGCRLEAARSEVLADVAAAPPREQSVDLTEGRRGAFGTGGADDDQQIIGQGRARGVGQQVRLRQQFLVRWRGHHDAGVDHARQRQQGALQLHQHDRVVIGALADLRRD